MSIRYRMVRLSVIMLSVLFFAVSVASGASSVPPVTNLHMVSGDANHVDLAWNAPSHGSTAGSTVDEYVILRDGHQIADLHGFNGMVDTSYIDGSPSSKKGTYAVIAVDSVGHRSRSASVNVPASQAPTPAPPAGSAQAADGVQSSSLCNAIIPSDIRGSNRPTGLEEYGCGEGMNAVNDSGPSHAGINLLVVHPSVEIPRPQHDAIQSFLIQLPHTIWQAIFLANSAFSNVVLQASTYHGVGRLFGEILQAFHGNPNYSGLIACAVALALMFLTFKVIRGERRKGYFSVGMIIAALTVLTVFLANPFRTMNFVVDKPLALFGGITSEVTDMTAGTDVANQFNLTVHPTFGGNKVYNSIRKSENIDWLMFQYLPQCAINFDDYNWTFTHFYPGTHTSFCEKFVQLWGNKGTKDERDNFKDKLKAANKEVANFFEGNNQGLRVVYSSAATLVLMVHLFVKFIRYFSIFACMFLLLGEALLAVLWLIYAVTGSDSAKLAAERRMSTAGHWLKVPSMMLLIMLVQAAGEANIVSRVTGSGFILLSAMEFLWDIVVLIGAFIVLVRLHREHKESIARLNNYRQQSSGLLAKTAGIVAAGAGAGAAAEVVRERHDRHRGDQDDVAGMSMPEDNTFDFAGFSQGPPQIEAGSLDDHNGRHEAGPSGAPNGNGDGGRTWDAETTSEDIEHEPRQLVMANASSANNGSGNNGDPDIDIDTDVSVDPDVIVDADVVVDGPHGSEWPHGGGGNFDSNGDSPHSDDDGFGAETDSRF
jgi:hypothetical protein